jgi:hypothetical protein
MITGFTAVRNTLVGGYPFVESILSALPACKKFVVSEGYSTDETYDVLKELADSNPKIELYRNKWIVTKNNVKGGKVLADAANEARKLCYGKGTHLLYVQANEIIHEDSIGKIARLPEEHPRATLFHLPFYHIIGKDLVFSEEYRIRLVSNLPSINAVGDAGFMRFSKGSTIKQLIKAAADPRKAADRLLGIMSPYGLDRGQFTHIMLPRPIFRYAALYRKSYIDKLNERMKLVGDKDRADLSGFVSRLSDNMSELKFKRLIYERVRGSASGSSSFSNPHVLDVPHELSLKEQPRIMRSLFASKADRYFVRKELLEPLD